MDNYQISKTVKISLRVTPTAKRNTYSVAWLVGCIPRVACFARNPGLGNRNTYSVAVGGSSRSIEAPSQPSPRGRSTNCWPIPAFFKVKESQQKPLPTFHMGKERHPSALNTVRWDSRPLGRVGEGLQLGAIPGLLPLAMPMEDYLPMTNSRVPPAMMSA